MATQPRFYYKLGSDTISDVTLNIPFSILSSSDFMFVKIGDGPEFFPTDMTIVHLNDKSTEFQKGLVEFSEPGPYLTQDGFILCCLKDNSITNFIDFRKVKPETSGPFRQHPDLIRPITSNIRNQYKGRSSLAICVENEDGELKFGWYGHSNWKKDVRKICGNNVIFHYGNGQSKKVMLSLNDESGSGSGSGTGSEANHFDSNFLVFLEDGGTPLEIETFMCFSSIVKVTSSVPPNLMPSVTALKGSFVHSLTSVGSKAFNMVRRMVTNRFSSWYHQPGGAAAKYYGPIVSLCQSSGSGKSKIAFELTKHGPGFFTVLRHENETKSYPSSNNVSSMLLNIMKDTKSESLAQLSNTPIKDSKSGKCIGLIAHIVVTYFVQLFTLVHENIIANKSLENAFRDIRPNVDEDVNLIEEVMLLSYFNTIMNKQAKKFEDVTVSEIADWLHNILEDPACLLEAMNLGPGEALMTTFVDELKTKLTTFPFIFVLDEATLLNSSEYRTTVTQKVDDIIKEYKTSGFSIFRRATAYLKEKTRIIVLTLGTKSDVIDLNQEVTFTSDRMTSATKLLPPILLSGNLDIFDEYSMIPFDPTPETLKNPITFKELVSYGHALWSSIVYSEILRFAVAKIKNGSSENYKTIPSLWMIRAGIKAEPTNQFAKDLVASKMATLFDVDPNFAEFAVSYPSDPVLAMAARELCNTDEHFPDVKGNEAIFRGLYEKLNTVKIDHGEYAENFAIMTLARAIDRSPNLATQFNSTEDYKIHLGKILNDCESDELRKLFSKNSYNLETDETDPTSIPLAAYDSFSGYHVTDVKNFLNTLFEGSITENDLEKLPQLTLDGIINASHFVKLTRDAGIDIQKVSPSEMPLANQLVPDKSRNVIDRALLRLGLRRQCGFLLPDRYFGIDAIIPVCLAAPIDKKKKKKKQKRPPVYSFIGVQIKTSQSVSSTELDAMQAKLHFVTCPQKNNPSHDGSTCVYCEDEAALETVFANQIAITLNMTGEAKKTGRNVLYNNTSKDMTADEIIKAIYSSPEFVFGSSCGNSNPDDEKEKESENGPVVGGSSSSNKSLKNKNNPPSPTMCHFAHEYRRASSNLEFSVRVWKNENGLRSGPSDESASPAIVVSKDSKYKKPRLDPSTTTSSSTSASASVSSSYSTRSGRLVKATSAESIKTVTSAKSAESIKTVNPTPKKKGRVHKMFVLEWNGGLDLIEKHFIHGAAAKLSATRILWKISRLNDYKEDCDVERFFRAVIDDGKVTSASHNYVTQEWRGHSLITTEETRKELVKSYVEEVEKANPVLKSTERI